MVPYNITKQYNTKSISDQVMRLRGIGNYCSKVLIHAVITVATCSHMLGSGSSVLAR